MGRPRSQGLTESELRLMNVVWAHEGATAQDIVDELRTRTPLAYTTVLTTLGILVEKGYLVQKKKGRAYLFLPRISREEAQRSAVQVLLARYFDESPWQLLACLLRNDSVPAVELPRIRQLLRNAGRGPSER